MAKQNKFGTFGGVFVPSILTILGVIMYLRLPMIVGEAGLWATIGIIVVAHIISVTTGLSVSSIATDKKVEAGGTYYMISRSLGLSIGGTLGLALFVGLSFSVSLYLIGFSESFLSYWGLPTGINNIRLTGSLVLLAVTTITFVSTSLAMKTQYFIMAAILLSLVSIFFGNHDFQPATPLLSNPEQTVPLMVLFGIFFPAVTGFEAGVSMSGDLKDPKKSIPFGSISAVTVGFVVYIILATFLAFTVDGKALATNGNILLNIAWVPELVIAGIWGATLSSALGSILGAPRILQATAIDKITPKFFAKGYGKSNEPRNALLLTFLIAESGILIGSLDAIASVVSVFFITTYGFLNISAAFEYWTSADFRPEFKVSGWISVIGSVACVLVMIQLDIVSMFGAIIILGLLFLYLKRKELTLDSGDTWSGVWASLVKIGLTNLKKDKLHNRNWRPNTIMFSGSLNERKQMIEMGKAISGKLGILSAFELIESQEKILAKTVSDLSVKKDAHGYFHHKLYCRDIYNGIDEIARVYGFSGVEPNTILMGWSANLKNKEKFIAMLENFEHYQYNAIFFKLDTERKFGDHQSIDIWWSGSGRNLVLAIYLIRHIGNSNLWRSSKVRLLIVNYVTENKENLYKNIAALLESYRVEFEIKIIDNELEPRSENEIIAEESAKTDLVLLGIPKGKPHQLNKYYDEVSEILSRVGTSLVINASEYFDELEVITNSENKQLNRLLHPSDVLHEIPSLQLSKFPEIATDISKIDINGQKVVELFFRKIFQPILNHHTLLLEELRERIVAIKKEFKNIEAFPDSYRKKKAIDKLKNDVFYKVNSLVAEDLRNGILPKQRQQLEEGIQWYEAKLQADFRLYPSSLTIKMGKEDFAVSKGDRSGLKNYKRIKRLNHWVLGGAISHTINYREVARFYQLNNRFLFISKLFKLFVEEETKFYHSFRKNINMITSFLDTAEWKIWQEQEDWQHLDKFDKIALGIEKEIAITKAQTSLYLSRLKLEFRKNLQLMNNDLGKIDIDYLLKKKTRKNSYYTNLLTEIAEFPEEYLLNIKTMLNKILMELSVNATKNRIETLNEEFNVNLRLTITQKYLKKLDTIAEELSTEDDLTKLQKVKLEEDIETPLTAFLAEILQRMLSLVDNMPESIEIHSSKNNKQVQETLSIPISRMAEYYFKSKYEIVIEDSFEELLEALKRSVYTVKDLINLTQFNLRNTLNDTTDVLQPVTGTKEVFQEALKRVKQEKEVITDKMNAFSKFTSVQLEQTFEPLSSVKIEESAKAFIVGLRNYQGQQVLSVFNRLRGRGAAIIQQAATRLFYSRSRGILLAKTLNNTSVDLRSANSRLLDLKEAVNIAPNLLYSIPPYYHTLFSNKSNIGKDFWVSRQAEESIFSKALQRYKAGYSGGILLLGDRNIGKTAFCKYALERYVKKGQIFSVFPPLQGTATKEGFTQALRKVTFKKGNASNVLANLPSGSVLAIHDLELFWERTENGMEVIHLLKQLIDEFSKHILFVINTNPHTYRLINQSTVLGENFIEVINFKPFDAEKLKNLIMVRHRSSGLSLHYQSDKPQLNEVQLAQLFNNYFDYSEGNPGTALNGWLAHIIKVANNHLIVEKPEYPSLSGLKDLNEEWTMLLTQFVLHKRLNLEKIGKVCQWKTAKTKSMILAMSRAGIITEKSPGIYQIDPCMHPFAVKALIEKEVLV